MSLKLSGLSAAYRDHVALKEVSFEAEYGKIHAFLGRNGAGKSSLFKCILGILPTRTGEMILNGQNLHSLNARERAQLLAFVPQKQWGNFPYRVKEMVLMGTNAGLHALRNPGKEEERIAELAMRQLGLEKLASRRYDQLSGGEQQLVLLARALAQRSKVLVLDEPTSSLDLGHSVQVMNYLKKLSQQGYMVLISTHNPQIVFSYADRVLVLQKGQLVAQGKPHEVLDAERLSDIYEVDIKLMFNDKGNKFVMTDSSFE